jgi:hypothetical protein
MVLRDQGSRTRQRGRDRWEKMQWWLKWENCSSFTSLTMNLTWSHGALLIEKPASNLLTYGVALYIENYMYNVPVI